MALNSIAQKQQSNRNTKIQSELLNRYKRYLAENGFENSYIKQLAYVRRNIPQVNYSLYKVKDESQLISKLNKLYEEDI